MLKSKSLLDQYLHKVITNKTFDNIRNEVLDFLYIHHNFSKGKVMDYITTRTPLEEADPALEYGFLEALDNIRKGNKYKQVIDEYFTELEKGKFSKWKVDKTEIPKEFRVSCFQVSDNQWIGSTDIHFFMKLREAQKIRYNENAQRVMKKVVHGEQIDCSITINWSQVKEIRQRYKEETFIPNVLTLNIPEDVDTDFEYDPEAKELIFHKITFLDMSDGYHRYLAACAEYDATDGTFNYPTEIRIINFSDKKTRDFIRQESLGTKMRKIDTMAMDSSSPANFLVDKINEDSNLAGFIKRNGGIINYSELSLCIYYYYLNKSNGIPRVELIKISKDIIQKLNWIIDNDPSLLNKIWDYVRILSTIIIIKDNRFTKKNINEAINKLINDFPTIISKRKLTSSSNLSGADMIKIGEWINTNF